MKSGGKVGRGGRRGAELSRKTNTRTLAGFAIFIHPLRPRIGEGTCTVVHAPKEASAAALAAVSPQLLWSPPRLQYARIKNGSRYRQRRRGEGGGKLSRGGEGGREGGREGEMSPKKAVLERATTIQTQTETFYCLPKEMLFIVRTKFGTNLTGNGANVQCTANFCLRTICFRNQGARVATLSFLNCNSELVIHVST